MLTRDPLFRLREATIEDGRGAVIALMEADFRDPGAAQPRAPGGRDRALHRRRIRRRAAGCAALYPFIDERRAYAEMACVAVEAGAPPAGLGEMLPGAWNPGIGVERLKQLTTRTSDWFRERVSARRPSCRRGRSARGRREPPFRFMKRAVSGAAKVTV